VARFLHTSDWQLGMTLHFLSPESQSRYSQARIDAVADLARVVADHQCDFVVVSGDVFETNRVSRQIVVRACEAMSTIPVPVLLLPGNHDPLDSGSVYTSEIFLERQPANVRVLTGAEVERPSDGVEVIGAPWRSKRPLEDLLAKALDGAAEGADLVRILVGHGAVDVLDPDRDNPAAIGLGGLETALDERVLDYVALGDRHSTTSVGSTGRIRYSGTPEVTDFDEVDPGNVLIVDLQRPSPDAPRGSVNVEPISVGHWRFLRQRFELSDETVSDLETWLTAVPDKQRTVVKLSLVGALTLHGFAHIERILDMNSDLFAALERWERHTELVVLPDSGELDALDLSGFAQRTLLELIENDAEGVGDPVARDAIALLYRLVGNR
jgi:DNA repair exonuclease SbcCD nuclease subunit